MREVKSYTAANVVPQQGDREYLYRMGSQISMVPTVRDLGTKVARKVGATGSSAFDSQ